MSDIDQRTIDLVGSLSAQVGKMLVMQEKMVAAIEITADRLHATRMALADTMKALAITAKHVPLDDGNYQTVMDAIISAAEFYEGKKNESA